MTRTATQAHQPREGRRSHCPAHHREKVLVAYNQRDHEETSVGPYTEAVDRGYRFACIGDKGRADGLLQRGEPRASVRRRARTGLHRARRVDSRHGGRACCSQTPQDHPGRLRYPRDDLQLVRSPAHGSAARVRSRVCRRSDLRSLQRRVAPRFTPVHCGQVVPLATRCASPTRSFGGRRSTSNASPVAATCQKALQEIAGRLNLLGTDASKHGI